MKKRGKEFYIKKYIKIGKFTVWIVNGNYIRKNINEEFTNFGQHYRFNFIPKNEFWIDKEYGGDNEKGYFIEHLLVENKLMAKGMCYAKAVGIAEQAEKNERKKSETIKKELNEIFSNIIIKKIHKKLLKEYSGKLKVWIVNGRIVRDLFYIDFTEGGHDKVYNFVPKNEIWIDDDLSQKERKFVFLHEIHERNLMAKGICYNSAHRESSKIEHFCRLAPRETEKKIEQELKDKIKK